MKGNAIVTKAVQQVLDSHYDPTLRLKLFSSRGKHLEWRLAI